MVRTTLEFPAAEWVKANAEEWQSLAEQAEEVGLTEDIATLLRGIDRHCPPPEPAPEEEMVEIYVPCISNRVMPKSQTLLAGFIESSDSSAV